MREAVVEIVRWVGSKSGERINMAQKIAWSIKISIYFGPDPSGWKPHAFPADYEEVK
jgi:hypothetical protein